MERKYCIINLERSKEHICFWGPNERGYYIDITKAGLYTLEEAKVICGRSDTTIYVPYELLAAQTIKCVNRENFFWKLGQYSIE